jgi:hypothetical protein
MTAENGWREISKEPVPSDGRPKVYGWYYGLRNKWAIDTRYFPSDAVYWAYAPEWLVNGPKAGTIPAQAANG